MKDPFVTCALCGHQFPESFVSNRGLVVCTCGLRIDSSSFGVAAGSKNHALTFMLLAAVIVLLSAAVVLARRLVG